MILKRIIAGGMVVVGLALGWAASRTLADDIWAKPGGGSSGGWPAADTTGNSNNATNTTVTVYNTAALPAGNNQIELTAQVRTSNPKVVVAAVEYFLDSTNNAVFGRGIALRPTAGYFNSSVVTVKATLTISSIAREHQVFVHARSADQQWSPFVAVEIPLSADDMVNRARMNNRPLGK